MICLLVALVILMCVTLVNYCDVLVALVIHSDTTDTSDSNM